MAEVLGWQSAVFLVQVVVLLVFGLLRARLHPGSGTWKGRLPRFNGFIEPICCRLFVAGSWLSDAIVGSRLVSQDKGRKSSDFGRRNALWIDGFVVLTLAVVAVSYEGIVQATQDPARWWLVVIPIWRLVDVLSVNLRINLFDHLIVRQEPSAVSATRMLILVFFNFVEISLSFACLYAASGLLRLHTGRPIDWVDPIYFSWITQLTIGYGDATPQGYLRLLAGVQGLIGLIVLVLFIGRFASSLPPIRSLHTHDSEEGGTERK